MFRSTKGFRFASDYAAKWYCLHGKKAKKSSVQVAKYEGVWYNEEQKDKWKGENI